MTALNTHRTSELEGRSRVGGEHSDRSVDLTNVLIRNVRDFLDLESRIQRQYAVGKLILECTRAPDLVEINDVRSLLVPLVLSGSEVLDARLMLLDVGREFREDPLKFEVLLDWRWWKEERAGEGVWV